MQLEERLDMPVSIINLKDAPLQATAKLMDVLARSKQCPYILKIEGRLDAATIVTESIEHANLRRYLSENAELSVNQKLQLVYQCCQAVEYAHSVLGHTFGSLRMENFGVTDEGEVRLIWFEAQSEITEDIVKYLPPAVSRALLGNNSAFHYPYSHENDVWQFGVLAWEILSESSPFFGLEPNDVILKLEQGLRLQSPHRAVPTSLYNLMLQTWDENPIGRPPMSNIVSEVRRIVTGATTRKRNNKVQKNSQARSYSSIGTLETSSNEGNNKFSQLKKSSNQVSNSSSPAKLEVVVQPVNGENKVDIRLLDRGTTIEV